MHTTKLSYRLRRLLKEYQREVKEGKKIQRMESLQELLMSPRLYDHIPVMQKSCSSAYESMILGEMKRNVDILDAENDEDDRGSWRMDLGEVSSKPE